MSEIYESDQHYETIAVEDLDIVRLGRQGENDTQQVSIDCSAWLTELPGAELIVAARRYGEKAIYLPTVTTADGIVTWRSLAQDTAVAGWGQAEIRAQVEGKIKKSKVFRTYVEKALDGPGTPAETLPDWVTEIRSSVAGIQSAVTDAQEDADAAALSAAAAEASAAAAEAAVDDMDMASLKTYERRAGSIQGTGLWGNLNGSTEPNYRHILVPVQAGDTVEMTRSGYDLFFALLTDDTAPTAADMGNAAPISQAAGFTGRMLLTASAPSRAFTVPAEPQAEGAEAPSPDHWLLLMIYWNRNWAWPSSLKVNGRELARSAGDRMQAAEEAITAIEPYVHPDCVYVDGSAAATGDGSAESPFLTIQEALDSGALEIRVKALNGNREPIVYGAFAVDGRKTPLAIRLWEMPANGPSIAYLDDNPKILVSGTTPDFGASIRNCGTVEISDMKVTGFPRYCFDLQNIQNLRLTRCQAGGNTFSEGGVTFSVFYFNNVNGVVRDCEAWDSRLDGFNIHGYGDTQFINCVAHDCDDDGISHHDRTTGAVIGGEYYRNSKAGVASPTYGAKVDVIGVYSHDNAQYGLLAASDSRHKASAARVSGCVFKDNGTTDIMVDYATVTAWNMVYDTKLVGANGSYTERANLALSGIESPADLQRLARRGIAGDALEIGQVIYVPWTDSSGADSPVTYQVPMTVVHIGAATDSGGTVHQGAIWLQWANAVPGAKFWEGGEQLNRYKDSGLRTWLNGAFFQGFPAEWRAVFGAVRVKTAIGNASAESAADLSYDTTAESAFLPSLVQMGGAPISGFSALDEGGAFSYWLNSIGGTPTNNASEGRAITALGDESGDARMVYLRTPNLKNATNSGYYVNNADGSEGALTAGSVAVSSGRYVCPVVVIY